MKKLRLFMFGCCMLLCACKVCNNLPQPDIPAAAAYTENDNLLTPEQHIALGKDVQNEWWSLFASERLNDIIQEAIQDNYELKTARQKVAQANEAVNAARGYLWPQIALDASAGRQKYGVAVFGPTAMIPPYTYYQVGVPVAWTVDLFGATRYNIEQQQALAAYQEHHLDAAYLTLTSNVVMLSLGIAAINEQIATMAQIIAYDADTLQLTQTKFDVGSATKIDILQAQSTLDSDLAIMPQLQKLLQAAKHALAILVGKPPANWQAPDFQLADFTLPEELPLTLPSELVRKRPDILAAEANLHAAGAAVGVATANMYPSLVLNASTFQEALTPGGLFKAAANAWAYSAGLTAPLFTGGTLSAQKRAAQHAYQAAMSDYQHTILKAFQQVADALSALANDSQAISNAQDEVNTARAELDLASKSYTIGSLGILQVQDKQRRFARAELELIRAASERYLDTARLFLALGGSPTAILN